MADSCRSSPELTRAAPRPDLAGVARATLDGTRLRHSEAELACAALAEARPGRPGRSSPGPPWPELAGSASTSCTPEPSRRRACPSRPDIAHARPALTCATPRSCTSPPAPTSPASPGSRLRRPELTPGLAEPALRLPGRRLPRPACDTHEFITNSKCPLCNPS
jgi:hypothetical protein